MSYDRSLPLTDNVHALMIGGSAKDASLEVSTDERKQIGCGAFIARGAWPDDEKAIRHSPLWPRPRGHGTLGTCCMIPRSLALASFPNQTHFTQTSDNPTQIKTGQARCLSSYV